MFDTVNNYSYSENDTYALNKNVPRKYQIKQINREVNKSREIVWVCMCTSAPARGWCGLHGMERSRDEEKKKKNEQMTKKENKSNQKIMRMTVMAAFKVSRRTSTVYESDDSFG